MGAFSAGLGLSPSGLLFYELVFPFAATWYHANLRSSERHEAWLSRILVTPAFHQVHHASERRFTDSNYSELISIWDWLFGTAERLSPEARRAMRVGLGEHYDADSERLAAQLMLPLRLPGANSALSSSP
jgi:sterol desaturase/sphingolipid hydroxylase (fatty acid hydroxylase superfamily)